MSFETSKERMNLAKIPQAYVIGGLMYELVGLIRKRTNPNQSKVVTEVIQEINAKEVQNELSTEVNKDEEPIEVVTESQKDNEVDYGVASGQDNKKGEKKWVDLVKTNWINPGSPLKYIPPVITNGISIAKIAEEDILEEEDRWKNAILGCVYGLSPKFYKLHNFIKNRWGKIGLIDFLQITPNLYAFVFESEEGKLQAMADGPITFDRHPLSLQECKRNMSFDLSEVAYVPVWVKLPLLPWEFWSPNSLSSIASTLGKPLFTDRCTRERSILAYARILIDMRLKGVFPDIVVIDDADGNQHTQFVEYEWKPILCESCNKLGHRNCEQKQIWIAKTSDNEAVQVMEEKGKDRDKPDSLQLFQTPPNTQEDGFQLVTSKKQKNKQVIRRTEDVKADNKSGGNSKAQTTIIDKILTKRLIKPLDRGR
ncbi:uncharacterized protein LOC126687696 [Mercurialis annua]|uniref:uncharacterized protein LOC126687696 n=1 Tax=Mercurialis annua TaxID=3986 RepID=UPI00215E4D16|nr:uncharacterized protein LOC126687696 [Mercurialis annua]